jgi:AraC-like DNA-binding protein
VDVQILDEVAILHLDVCSFGLPAASSVDRPGGALPWLAAGGVLRESLWSVADVGAIECVSHDVLAALRRDGLLPPASPRDPRVIVGLGAARELGSVTEAAAAVGLSRGRFRSLVRHQVGSTPTRLRVWQRLCFALSLMDDRDLAQAAAAAGFADQPHLTRTCTRFLGASPGWLRPLLRVPAPHDAGSRSGDGPCAAVHDRRAALAPTEVISPVE